MYRYLVVFFISITLYSCRPDTYVPKPRGYFGVSLPQHAYQKFDLPGFPYSFDYPTYSTVVRDTLFFGQKAENPYWVYINFPDLNGRIYISYKQISPAQPFSKLMEDAHKLSYFHTKKADDIRESSPHMNPNNVTVVLYDVLGDAASTYQFVATDSFHHFIRGALYFDVSPNADSLKPANDFMRVDIERLLNTLKWK
ncbi:MAG: hypothetical protein H0X33_10980 [Taibaiella sp.]|nr:hypothetical protein [Taibaiella sp.]